MPLTHEHLRELLSYDPLTGVFTRLATTSSNAKAGDHAGYRKRSGYVVLSLDGTQHQAHRLAWFYVHSVWPPDEIDHINGVRHDNRIANLRCATRSENMQNEHRLIGHNTSGTTGVNWYARTRRWRAYIALVGRTTHIGYFDTKEAAIEARSHAEKLFHPFKQR